MAEKQWYIPEDAITDRSANPLAVGGFGEVFTASYYGAPVAVKQLYRGYNQNELADFGREIGIWHRLSHPHVLPLLGACDTATKPFMVSPFMPNGTLHRHISTATPPRPLGEKIRLLYEIASGMAYLHGNNIVHGDLKSLNVLLDRSFSAVVNDFGLSKTKHTSATANRTRRDQPTGGTLEYMAPEMLDDDNPVGSSKATDVYAFGITIYEVLNDCRPIWVTADGQPMRERVIESQVLRNHRPKQLEGIPDDIRALIERCWHQDPAERPKFSEILAILHRSDRYLQQVEGQFATVLVDARHSDSSQHNREIHVSRSTLSHPLTSDHRPSATRELDPAPVKDQTIALSLLNLDGEDNFDSDEEIDDEYELWFAIAGGGDREQYRNAFTRVYTSSRHQPQITVLISAIATSQPPLTIRLIAELFGVDIRVVRRCIRELGPVLNVGNLGNDMEGNSADMAQKHKPIAAYLIGEESVNEPYHVSAKFHMAFASQCLLSILSHEPVINICDIYDFHDKISDLKDRVKAKITPSLRYSVAHWITHFVWCLMDGAQDRHAWRQYRSSGLADSLTRFLSSHIFFWLEVGSLIGTIPELSKQAGLLEDAVVKSPGQMFDDATKELVRDIHRFIREFADPISKSAPQVYNTGYAFTPKETAIYKAFSTRLEDKIPFLVTFGFRKTWDCPDTSIEGHVGAVTSVAVSPDGTWFASRGSDGTIKLWDIAKGKARKTLTGHSNVTAITISADGRTIVAIQADCAIKHLDANTGEFKDIFAYHSKEVYRSATAPDGTFVAIVNNDDGNRIKIWDTVTCSLRQTLEGHTRWVSSLAISPDGKWVVSGSRDNTVKVWDAATGQLKSSLEGHLGWVNSVAISPDGTSILSRDDTHKHIVWAGQGGKFAHTSKGPSDFVAAPGSSLSPEWSVIDWRNSYQWARHCHQLIKLPQYLGRCDLGSRFAVLWTSESPYRPMVVLPIYLNTPETQIAFATYLSNSPVPESQARAADFMASPEVMNFNEESAILAQEQAMLIKEARRTEDAARRAEAARKTEAARIAEEARKAEEAAKSKGWLGFFG